MRWYADTPLRRTRQVLADVLVLTWVLLWLVVGRWVHGTVLLLAAPADPLRNAGSAMRSRMEEVAGTIGDVPMVGGRLDDPFLGAAGVGTDLISAGDGLEGAVGNIALCLSVLVVGTPIVLVLAAHLLWRLSWARRASALGRELSSAETLELLALRALLHQPAARLHGVAADPVAAWRAGDPEVTRALAALELRRMGLRPPVAS